MQKGRANYLKTAYLGANNPNHKGRTVVESWWHDKVARLQHTASQRGLTCSLTAASLQELYVRQNGMCYYTGIPLQLASTDAWKRKGQADPDILSVDRIDSHRGYEPDNVVLCCTAISRMKGNAPASELQNIFNFIVAKHLSTCHAFVSLEPGAQMPTKAKMDDAGYDLWATSIDDTGDRLVVHTGVHLQPTPGWFFEVVPRSSIVKRGLMLLNSVGVIDNGYTGEIVGVFHKLTDTASVAVGDRVLQILPRRYSLVTFHEVPVLSETQRGDAGFGSTGR